MMSPPSRDPRGWYVQGVYQFTPHWSTGIHYTLK